MPMPEQMTGIVEQKLGIVPRLDPPLRRTLLGIHFDAVTLDEAVEHALRLARSPSVDLILTPNVDHLIRTRTDPHFKQICQQGSLVLADGLPVVWASRWLNCPLPERVAGADVMPLIAVAAARSGLRYFFLGGTPGDAKKAAAVIAKQAGRDGLCGIECPPFGFEKDKGYVADMAARINAARPDILFVGLGSPKQEKLMVELCDRVHAKVMMAVGVTFSFLAGTVKRAPRRVQTAGFEWLWRLSREPRRLWRRYARNLALFPWLVFREKVRSILWPQVPGR
jgi:N-acetylglucosaminyldiphosphoundecaprenol N-acetyl-beta-D-mannosaminyltransferase